MSVRRVEDYGDVRAVHGERHAEEVARTNEARARTAGRKVEEKEREELSAPRRFVEVSGTRFNGGDKTLIQGWTEFHKLASRLFPVDWSQGYPRPLVEMRDARGNVLTASPKLGGTVLSLAPPAPDHGRDFLPYALDGSNIPRVDGVEHINRTRKKHSRAVHNASTSAAAADKRYIAKKIGELGADGYRSQKREYDRQWREANPAKAGARYDKSYHRPFVAIDAEGMDFPEDDRAHNGAVYPKHKTFLWGAKGWRRDVERALTPEEIKLGVGRNGSEFGETWLGEDKKPLAAREIFDWLLALPKIFGDVNFVMYSFGYDMTQILAGLPYETAYEIVKQESYKKGPNGKRRKFRGDVFYGPYGISYLKGKFFKVGRLRDANKPFVDDDNGKKRIDYETSIMICDAFGFYAKPFADVVKSMIGSGYATKEHYELIKATKGERHEFANVDFDRVKHYCGLELLYLSKALTVLRDGFDRMDIRLKSWSGAGSAAGALITKQQLKKRHFSTEIEHSIDQETGRKQTVLSDIRRADLTPQQSAAHAAYYGARIELLKQGYAPETELHGYDIRSAYPSAMVDLPSMRGKTWKHFPDGVKLHHVRYTNILSMYRVVWKLPAIVTLRQAQDQGDEDYAPFYPLPYRTENGSILFPSHGHAWVMRDDILAALKWLETFAPESWQYQLVIMEAYEFDPPAPGLGFSVIEGRDDEGPFEFVRKLYDQRANIKRQEAQHGYDIQELAIKLCLNSLYGKFAQRIGGNEFDPPASACPYYAAAITAATRRRICETGLLDPFAIVMFATDGIVSTRPLAPLDRPIGEALGDWETKTVTGGMFLQSGFYTFFDGGAHETKMRGARKSFIELPSDPVAPGASMSRHAFLISETLAAWRKPQPAEAFISADEFKKRNRSRKRGEHVELRQAERPTVTLKQKTFVTVGAALASPASWRVVGRWSELERVANVHDIGVKRAFVPGRGNFYYSIEGRGDALRCSELVPTIPSVNATPEELSRPAIPDWIDRGEDIDTDYGEPHIFNIGQEEAQILADF